MNHLRLFESFKKAEYYSVISKDEYDPLLNRNGDYITFEEKYYKILIEMGFEHVDTRLGCCNIYRNGMSVDIYQRKDEYFDVHISSRGNLASLHKYYRCDQFEGLLKLLKDKKLY